MQRFNYSNVKSIIPWLLCALGSVLYFWWPMHVDFYSDEGYFSEMTSRLMRGEFPNVDFASNYLGLFYAYNAVWFWLLGPSFFSLRMGMLFLTSVLFVPVVYQIARRLMAPIWAILATLLVVGLSVSLNNNVSGNWYALYFSVLAFWLALVAFDDLDSDKRKLTWIFCGLALGVSFLMKHTVAVYTGFALLMMLSLRALYQPASDVQDGLPKRDLYPWMLGILSVIASIILPPLFVLFLIHDRLDMFRLLFYLLPVLMIASWVGKRLLNNRETIDYCSLGKQLAWLIFGALLPVGGYLAPYAVTGTLITLLKTVFVDYPKIYLQYAFLDYLTMVRLEVIVPALWMLLLFWLIRKSADSAASRAIRVVFWLVLSGGVIAVVSLPIRQLLNGATGMVLQLPLWVIAIGLIVCWRTLRRLDQIALQGGWSESHTQLLTTVVIWIWGVYLFQGTYPLGMMFYYTYMATPLILVMTYVLSRTAQKVTKPIQAVLVLWVACGVLLGGLMAYRQTGWYLADNEPIFPNQRFTEYLNWPEGRIYISPTSEYGDRTARYRQYIARHSQRNDDIFMYSDGPEVYFITRHINPTRYSYAIDSRLSDGSDIVAALEKHRTRLVFYDVSQNHFQHPILDAYLQENFQLKDKLTNKVLVFERVKSE